MEKIKNIAAYKILDSRGEETIKVKIFSQNFFAEFSLPQGKSKGKYEACYLAPEKAIENIKKIIFPKIKNKEVNFQKIDQILLSLDKTPNKRKIGGNATLGVSIACAKLQAKIEKKPLFLFLERFFKKKKKKKSPPFLLMNVINGGLHAKGGVAFQEYHLILKEKSLKESVFLGAKLYRKLGEKLETNIGDEGGYVPQMQDEKEPLFLLQKIKKRKIVSLGLDVAASSFFKNGKYFLKNKTLNFDELLNFYLAIEREFDLLYLEDPFEESGFEKFSLLRKKLKKTLICGDDLTVTNKERLKEAIKKSAIDLLLVKPNQIGTLSETIEAINFARENNIDVVVSHRSGETEDTFIADLAVACNAWGAKFGAPARGERTAKYNRLIEIENGYF